MKIAFKGKEAFPNKAKDIIEYLKDNPFGENNIYNFSKVQTYHFKFKRTPDKTVTELFGHNTDAKWSNILYVGQIAEKDINVFEKNRSLQDKVRSAIDRSKDIQF